MATVNPGIYAVKLVSGLAHCELLRYCTLKYMQQVIQIQYM